jgi:hypothetical protein
MLASKAREILEELRSVVLGRSNLVDSVVPPVLFLIVNALLGFDAAMGSSLVVALGITALRLVRRQPVLYALGGIAGTGVAIGVAILSGRAEGFFLPGIVSGAATVLICLVSVLAGRPLVAWTSYVTRRWPLDWYWHPRVRPAYSEVTWMWVVFFGLRLALQIVLFEQEATGWLALANVVLGWPATIVLLVVSYVYGTWRLRSLGGPSVEEFRAGADPPWESQRRGF